MFYVDVQNTFSYILLKAYTFTAITGGLKNYPEVFYFRREIQTHTVHTVHTQMVEGTSAIINYIYTLILRQVSRSRSLT